MRFVLSAAMVLLITAGAVIAEESENAKDSLRGLTSVYVLVEDLDPGIEADGLKEAAIQIDAELKLRLAGIKVITQTEGRAGQGSPYLYINVHSMATGERYAMTVEVELHQNVRLDRQPTSLVYGARTWRTSSLGTVGKSRLSGVRDAIKGMVDEFIKDYLSVNPK